MMELIERQVPGAVVVEIHGKLIGSVENCETFHSVFRSLLNEGKNRIIVDLEHTPWANSQGIGMLIGAHTSVSNAGGQLVLTHVNDRIRDVLVVTKLDLVFKAFHSENTAVQYLTGRPQMQPGAQPPMATT
jgi:anti-sigma B factor antagonist